MEPVISSRPLQRITSWTGRVLSIAFAVLAVGAVGVIVVVPRLTHGQAMTVLSGSMTPGIPVGSIVVVRPVDPATLEVGDVATYQAEPGKPVYITHRIVGIDKTGSRTTYTFKGDANRGADVKPVVEGQIRGQMWFHVPYLGTVRDLLKTGGGQILFFSILLGGYAISQLANGLREQRDKGRHVNA